MAVQTDPRIAAQTLAEAPVDRAKHERGEHQSGHRPKGLEAKE
jgi:hypothetical protein